MNPQGLGQHISLVEGKSDVCVLVGVVLHSYRVRVSVRVGVRVKLCN